MWWTLVIVILAAAACAGVLLVHGLAARRRRTANWDDLHERGKLFAAQLSRLREMAAHKENVEPPKAPPPGNAKKSVAPLPRRATLQRRAGSSSAALDPAARDRPLRP